MDPALIGKLRCPVSRQPLRVSDDGLVSQDGRLRYRVTASGIPLFGEQSCSEDAKVQRNHYEKIADAYVENLGYPHTQEYMRYLDETFLREVAGGQIEDLAEICCGHGEAFKLLRDRVGIGVGVDISPAMLEVATTNFRSSSNLLFVQGDATNLPLQDSSFSAVAMLGGIHHVRDRMRLFSEVARILKPGGRFYWREPVSDFVLWRSIRAIVYRVSATLDAQTERPLLYRETEPVLVAAGLQLESWKTYGFLGFCLFMNSDVLVFNRLFRFVPGIRPLTRAVARIDDWTTRLPGLGRSGLQVVGVARKPAMSST